MRKVGGALSLATVLLFLSVFVAVPAHASPATAVLRRASGSTTDSFGAAIDVSRGATVVGAPSDNARGTMSGSAHVFARDASSWGSGSVLTASDGTDGDRFGTSVAISDDTIVAGAFGDDDAGSSSGSAYVFTRSSGVWRQTAKLRASDGETYDMFGYTVDVEGTRAVIGAPYEDTGRLNAGAAYVFERSGSSWVQRAKLTAADTAVRAFGSAISISGNRILIGGTGGAFVYTGSGSTWTRAELVPQGAPIDGFGTAVAISGDRALVGAPQDDDGRAVTKSEGSVFVFRSIGSSWVQEAKLHPSDRHAFNRFGSTVSLAGTTALISSPYPENYTGAAYLFRRTAEGWIEQQLITAPTPAEGHRFGIASSIASGTAVVGATGDAAYVYEIPSLSMRGSTTTGLVPDGAGAYLGGLGRPYGFAFTVANDGELPAWVSLQAGETGAVGKGDTPWGPVTATKQIDPGALGTLSFDVNHAWEWTVHEPSIPGSIWRTLSQDVGCGDLTNRLEYSRSAIQGADTQAALAQAARDALASVDAVRTFTYDRRAGSTQGVTFDPIVVRLAPSPIQLESFLQAVSLGLGAKGLTCAGWLAARAGDDALAAPAFAAAAVTAHASDLLYGAAWQPGTDFRSIAAPASYSLGSLGSGAWRAELADRLAAVAGLQEARTHALRRFEAATRAGDHAWAVRQLEAAQRWTGQLGDHLVAIDGLSDTFVDELPATMSASDHVAFADAVGRDGLPAAMRSNLGKLGVGAARADSLASAWAVPPASPRSGQVRTTVRALLDLQTAAERSMATLLARATTDAYRALGVPDAVASATGSSLNGWFSVAPSVTIGDGSPLSIQYRLNGGAWRAYDGAFSLTTDGVHELLSRASTGAKTQDPPRATLVRVDRGAPSTTVAVPGPWNREPVLLELRVSDAVSGPAGTSWSVRAVAGGTERPGVGRLVGFDQEGRWRLTYWSSDVAGNIEAARTATVQLDFTPPRSDIEEPLAPTFVRTVSLEGTATDATSGVGQVLLRFHRLDAVSGAPIGDGFTQVATLGNGVWSYSRTLTTGRYRVWPEATDVAGHIERDASADAIEIVVV